MVLSVVTAIVGILRCLSLVRSAPGGSGARGRHRPGRFTSLVLHKYYIDEIYDALFVNRVKESRQRPGRV